MGHDQESPVATNMVSIKSMICHMKLHIVSYKDGLRRCVRALQLHVCVCVCENYSETCVQCACARHFFGVQYFCTKMARNCQFFNSRALKKITEQYQRIGSKIEIVMNGLRRFKHSADLLTNSSHIIESAAISASQVSTPLTHLH